VLDLKHLARSPVIELERDVVEDLDRRKHVAAGQRVR